ncbi:3-oxo-tetronate 4-phosphate decarboxylase [Bythopirellula polymerisocia]|uniref:3-oxo-tetronate 4-phosphate decarboxylase n=1 Tax=Bythopirellula polymerisocia TaxID=2528003 RepID=A0A5C6CXS0_9BACT|nr:3-oxo-tetronate 4-phosphate decarboxylase [Bythopirellula polymerisocia]TWU28695.1 L-fuculose phosphate aldolase [Bythopirellula polymerisocia]
MNEQAIRKQFVFFGKSLHQRGYACGSSGNISVRIDQDFLVSPTNSCLGQLEPEAISKINADGELLDGAPPTKEARLHLAYYAARPQEQAIVHLHSTYAVAISCLANLDSENVIPPLTAYFVMRIGKLPLVPFFPPGDAGLAEAVGVVAGKSHAILLANHGPVVGGRDLESAVYAAEELEETAKLYLLLRGATVSPLSLDQCSTLDGHRRASAPITL